MLKAYLVRTLYFHDESWIRVCVIQLQSVATKVMKMEYVFDQHVKIFI